MSKSADEKAQRLRELLGQRPASGRHLAEALHVSQPVFSRICSAIRQEIIVAGKARATRYALRRPINGSVAGTPLFDINKTGHTRHVATIYAVAPRGFFVDAHTPQWKTDFYEDVPYYIYEMRPSGFLGRRIARALPALHLPVDPRDWSDEATWRYLTNYGTDVPGNLLLGEAAMQRLLEMDLNSTKPLTIHMRAKAYAQFAAEVIALGPPGSSAAGEQAKFLARIESKHQENSTDVLVKFSSSLQDPAGRRLGDLLLCEHLAHNTLLAAGHPSLTSEWLHIKNRAFLQTVRYDRFPPSGRVGVCTMATLDLQYVGSLGRDWREVGAALLQQGSIDKETSDKIRWLQLFGHLIANSDMHTGNLSFFVDGESILGLTPTYDMLPMFYAPQHGDIHDRIAPVPTPSPCDADIWPSALSCALEFWRQVAGHKSVSADFQKIATEHLRLLEMLHPVLKRLPAP